MPELELEPIEESKPEDIISAEVKPFTPEKIADIPIRTDLNPGHFLYGKKAARCVLSGETDKVVIEYADRACNTIESVSSLAELIAKEVEADPSKNLSK